MRARLTDRGQPRALVGDVDLFLELPDGFVVVDHKSFPGNDRDRDERVVKHAAQLGLYAFALERALRKPMVAAFINLPIRGKWSRWTWERRSWNGNAAGRDDGTRSPSPASFSRRPRPSTVGPIVSARPSMLRS